MIDILPIPIPIPIPNFYFHKLCTIKKNEQKKKKKKDKLSIKYTMYHVSPPMKNDKGKIKDKRQRQQRKFFTYKS